MPRRLHDLVFPIACLISAVVFGVASLEHEDENVRNQGLGFAITLVSIGGTAYQSNKNNSDDY